MTGYIIIGAICAALGLAAGILGTLAAGRIMQASGE